MTFLESFFCGLVGGFSSMRFFKIFVLSLFIFAFVSLPIVTFADDSNTLLIDFSQTGSETAVSDMLREWLGVPTEASYTYSDFATDLADTYIGLYFGVRSTLASDLYDAVLDLVHNSIFGVDTTTGFVKEPPGFVSGLRDIYERLGFIEVSVNIGYWRPLPFEYGNVRIYSNESNMYGTRVEGSGGSRFIVAIRSQDSSSTVLRMFIASGASASVASVNTFYQGTNHSGFWKQVSDASSAVAVSNLWSENNYPYYYDTNVSVAVDGALADFFGNSEPSSDPVWNGDLYFDDTPKQFTINNVFDNNGLTNSILRWGTLDYEDKTPSDNIRPYFVNNDNRIYYYPNFSDIPNNHNFELVDYPSGEAPDLTFEFNYTIAEDTNGFMSVLDSSMVGIIGTIVTIGAVFLLLGVIL